MDNYETNEMNDLNIWALLLYIFSFLLLCGAVYGANDIHGRAYFVYTLHLSVASDRHFLISYYYRVMYAYKYTYARRCMHYVLRQICGP